MHVKKILQQLLKDAIHNSRIKSLEVITRAIIISKQLKLTQLGRNLNTNGKERGGIRRTDRVLANKFYQKNNIEIYKCITQCAIGCITKPIILIDWTSLPNSKRLADNGEHIALRACLAAKGRSITLYDEVHPKKKDSNSKVHSDFLEKLSSILPPGCKPLIVTDAGFKNPWFKAVESLGWDYIGRVCGTVCYDNGDGYKKISLLFSQATQRAKCLGEILLSKTNKFKTNLFLYKHKLKGRKKITRGGKIDATKDSKKCAKRYRDPWVLVSSLSKKTAAKKIVKIYKLRMGIEENFRDVKSVEYGLSMNENGTRKPARYIVWLMLSALASITAWIVGYIAESMNIHYEFQVNTCRNKRVLSFFYLGCRMIAKRKKIPINIDKIRQDRWGIIL